MKIITVAVHYQETRSLPNYSNVQPSVSLTVQLEDDEDFHSVINDLFVECKAHVQEEIDAALVANDCSPRYRRRADEGDIEDEDDFELPCPHCGLVGRVSSEHDHDPTCPNYMPF